MYSWKMAAIAAVVGAAGTSAVLGQVVHGQAATPAPRAVQIFGGRGSQIGVTIRDVEESIAGGGKVAASSGVVIESVVEDGPAAKAGVKKDDVVLEFDGERVRSVRQFARLVQETPSGRPVQATVLRGGQRMNLTIEPREADSFGAFRDLEGVMGDLARELPVRPAVPPRPAKPAAPAQPTPPVPPTPFPDIDSFIWRTGNGLGITVGDLSSQLAEYFGARSGVLVTSVGDDSAGAKAGIKAGDVVTSFDGSEVTSPSELRRRIQRLHDGDDFTATIVRDKKSLTLKGKIEAERPRRTYRSVI